MAIDKIGQEVKVGDWAAITQHNEVYVGKVIKATTTVTIAINRAQEWLLNNQKEWNKIHWKDQEAEWEKMFGPDAIKKFGTWGFRQNPSWVRDDKYIKITPTKEMELKYENGIEI